VVSVGKDHFEDNCLKFFLSIDECLVSTRPTLALCCGVLQYLKDPFSVLSRISQTEVDTLVIDRTPFWEGESDRLCVQHIPKRICESSYPSWIFSYPLFYDSIQSEWAIMAEFDALDKLPSPVEAFWKGFILQRKAVRKVAQANHAI